MVTAVRSNDDDDDGCDDDDMMMMMNLQPSKNKRPNNDTTARGQWGLTKYHSLTARKGTNEDNVPGWWLQLLLLLLLLFVWRRFVRRTQPGRSVCAPCRK